MLRPALRATSASELPLSGVALLALLRAVLGKGARFRFCARGWSMAPFIRDGDVITVAPLGPARPGLGEVVAFVHGEPERLAVHRVVGRVGVSSLIQGDNVDHCPDGLVVPGQILGRVTCVERGGRRVRLGLGPERLLIALCSRRGLLAPCRRCAGPVLRALRRASR